MNVTTLYEALRRRFASQVLTLAYLESLLEKATKAVQHSDGRGVAP